MPKDPSKLHATLSVTDMPELIGILRAEMATILMDEADAESRPCCARRLREAADAFDAGQRPGAMEPGDRDDAQNR
jgi:hypothetical protein